MRDSRTPEKLKPWKDKCGNNASIGTFEESAQYGEVLVFEIKGTAAEEAQAMIGLDKVKRKDSH